MSPAESFTTQARLVWCRCAFRRRHCLAIHQSAADHQGRRTGLYEKDVRLGFVPLRLAVTFPVDQHRAFIGKIPKQLGARWCGSFKAPACRVSSKCLSEVGVQCSNPGGVSSWATATTKRIEIVPISQSLFIKSPRKFAGKFETICSGSSPVKLEGLGVVSKLHSKGSFAFFAESLCELCGYAFDLLKIENTKPKNPGLTL